MSRPRSFVSASPALAAAPPVVQERRHRPPVPDKIALAAAILHGQVICGCGCGAAITPGEMEREHDPALELRAYDPKTRTYSPDANDPEFIRLYRVSCHRLKTHGPGGEKRITTRGSDNHTARRIRRLAEKQRRHAEAMSNKGKEVNEMAAKQTRKPGKKPDKAEKKPPKKAAAKR